MGPTLTETLRRLGYRHRQASTSVRAVLGQRDVLSGEAVVFTGRAHEVWAWLRREGRIK